MSNESTDYLFYVSLLSIIIIPFIIIFIVKIIKDGDRKRREARLLKFAKKTKVSVKPYFGKFLKDCGDMSCFANLLNTTFCNVIEKLDKENGDVYIGELQAEVSVRNCKARNPGMSLVAIDSADSNYVRLKRDCTLCVLYDDKFNLPSFDLFRETLKQKAIEILRMNETVDIDFDDDKEFSDAWWLSSNDNVLVRELFTKNIRSNFMNFVDKGYRICGRRNVIFIITDNILCPEDYSRVISDIRMIQRFMKNNKKFYTPLSERQSTSGSESDSCISQS